jgi:hypothetical protein
MTHKMVKDKIDNRLMAPEEEKKNKELRTVLEAIQGYLNDDKFDEACLNFSKVKQMKNYEWFEVCGLWTYIVKKRNTRYVKIILDLITKSQAKNPDPIDQNTHNILKTKNKLYNIYGHSRMRGNNPYELYDHKAVNNEIIIPNVPPSDFGSNTWAVPNELSLKQHDFESFKKLTG